MHLSKICLPATLQDLCHHCLFVERFLFAKTFLPISPVHLTFSAALHTLVEDISCQRGNHQIWINGILLKFQKLAMILVTSKAHSCPEQLLTMVLEFWPNHITTVGPMEPVQVGKAVVVKKSNRTLGIKPWTLDCVCFRYLPSKVPKHFPFTCIA